MTTESTSSDLPALAVAAVPRWLATQVQQAIAATGAAGYAPLPLAVAEALIPTMAERVTTRPAPPLDEPTGRFYAALGQASELAAAFAILCYILPSAVPMPGPGGLIAVPGEGAAGDARCS